ncbi:hypothetical protein SAMN02745121_00343 [Nannocystis exedens]|uniref:Uncharacterized protein n=1 Tax=Nannocystis exedens TaxID=54 RepID=A0A1I1SX48_9BACT|nr:hypothetical protein [Nannocystis exedens]PCC66927.1 hypothetical protein NAEX_09525 [Nannocystis exedens]SFD51017.1 hypothetical protein SAMN02745121_00343 [Nannocystis exedens]
MSTRPAPALVLALLLACGDSTSATTDGGSATGTGSTTTSTSGHVPTTSDSAVPTSGASDSLSATGPTTGDPTTTLTGGETTTTTTSPVTATDATTDATGPASATETAGDGTATSDTTTATGDTGDTSTTTGMGGCRDDTDCPAEASECHAPACQAGVCDEVALLPGAPCATGVCDGEGTCVACLLPDDCPMGQLCVAQQCVPPTCDDGAENGMETDVDCGGPACAPCNPGGACDEDGDCASGVCTGQVCQAAACDDGVENGGESDVDCGGDCPPCGPGDGCDDDLDCQSQVCTLQVCQAPSCSDAKLNGQETDVDCGGPTCPECQAGETCEVGSDCDSGVCTGQTCQPPTCNDDLHNGEETDVDCGGPTCPECQTGEGCLIDADCATNVCENGVCVDPLPACASAAPDPATGQRCPLFMPCAANSECGVFQGCQQWFCNPSKTCELNALSNCGTTKGGGCNAGVVFVQTDDPPVDKRFLPPDGVDFREVATLAFTVYNNTASALRLDKVPLMLETMGGGSAFDVSSAKIYQDSGGAEYSIGDQYIHLTASPFSFPANGVLGPAAGSAFSQVNAGQSKRFIITLAFAKEKTFIAGRSYRVKLVNPSGVVFKVGFNGPDYAGSNCGVPPEGFIGAWVTAQNP